jgi:uncharacterized membrane protein YvlD (DUF360 family)
MADRSLALPIRLVLQYALTVLLLWVLARVLPQYLVIEGSWAALPTVAALVMLLNMFARPILKIVTLPLKLFMTIAAIVIVNAAFLWILTKIAENFDPQTAIFLVEGGLGGWIVIALALGLGNWVLHHVI